MNVFDKDKILLLWTPQMGLVVRQDGVLKYISKGVDASQELVDGEYEWRENHLVQPTASQQPRLVGGIAPGSKVAASNQNGEARYFTHPAISFGATDAWSATVRMKWSGSDNMSVNNGIITSNSITYLALRRSGINRFSLRNESALNNVGTAGGTNSLLGKVTTVTYVANGDGKLHIYKNGVFYETIVVATNLVFLNFAGVGAYTFDSGLSYNLKSYLIQSTALTPTQVADLHTTLRGLYPEIESVDIGTQTWATSNLEMVATPMGNVINNVTDNGAVEKLPDPTFELTANQAISTIGAYWRTFENTSIVSGKVVYDGLTYGRLDSTIDFTTVSGKWYKKTVVINSGTASLIFRSASSGVIGDIQSIYPTGTTSLYFKATVSTLSTTITLYNVNGGTACEIESISLQELGWAEADEIYNAVYAATSGTHDQKHYAALKEAAMWRYPNNSIDKGAWGGKLYNKYAMMLLSLDMASANFGYHIPTNAEVVELLAQVGGDTNKLKYVGLDYWNDAIGTNESGLTLLGTGVITPGGVYTGEKELTGFWTSDSNEFPTSGLPIRIVKNV